MNQSSLLDRLSPRPACPLVRLGPSKPLLGGSQSSAAAAQNANNNNNHTPRANDIEDYYTHPHCHAKDKYELYSASRNRNAKHNRLPFDHRYDDTPLQSPSASASPSPNGNNECTNHTTDRYLITSNGNAAKSRQYYNRPSNQSQSHYRKQNLDLTSLSLSAGYWEHETYNKSVQSSDSSQEFFEANPRFGATRSKKLGSDYLMDNYLKLGKNSPSLDQGYHTLVTTSPGCSTPTIWSNADTQIYRGKSRFQVKNNSFDRLTDELIVRVFSLLNSYELSVCARVCRRFDHLVWQPELWRTISLAGETLSGDRAIRAVLRQLCGQGTTGACTQVERVHVTDGAKISDKGVILLARRCPEITHLQINATAGVTNTSLNEIVNRCSNLQHLDVTGCVQVTCLINIMGPDPSKRLQLQYLDLTDCSALQDNGLRIIVRNCPLLAYLYLRRCTEITDAGFKFVPSFCSNLRELSVSDCTNITDFGLYELAKLGATLRYLSVAKCDQVSDAGLKVVARRCYKLRYLNVRGCEAVSDDAITVLARSCTRLRALDIGKCDVSDAGLRALAESCPNLKKLSLRNCDLVTDRGVQSIAYYCRGLQQLNIQDCQISLDGYRAVKKYCKRCIIEHTNPGFF